MASASTRPEWVLFDMNGTLLDPRAIGRPLTVGDPQALVLSALDEAVGQAMAGTLAADVRPFPEYLEAALRRRLEVAEAATDGLDEAMEIAGGELPPFDDAAAAIDLLAGAGVRVGVLTNSATGSARETLERAGLAARLEVVVGADSVGAYKPDRRVYARAVEEVGAAPGQVCLVAAHWWDVLGAHHAGLRTGWVARKERVLLATVPEPDFRAETLEGIARAITG